MPAQRVLPDSGTLIRLRRQGWTYQDIAREYHVTQGAVYQRLRDAGATKTVGSHKELIPWRVRTEHQHDYPAMMLRYLSRQRQGTELKDQEARMLRKWLADLRSIGAVVTYDASIPPNPASPKHGGWAYVLWEPEDGTEAVIRKPVRAKASHR